MIFYLFKTIIIWTKSWHKPFQYLLFGNDLSVNLFYIIKLFRVISTSPISKEDAWDMRRVMCEKKYKLWTKHFCVIPNQTVIVKLCKLKVYKYFIVCI